jgi:3',5'-nucleoside bisphosphate phosphatase
VDFNLKPFRAELHVHTVLSPCAEVEMIPPLIVEESLARGIDIIAITDHNSTYNIESVQKAAIGTPLVVLSGMELQTIEEVHSLCIFESLEQVNELQKVVSRTLPPIKNDAEHFGEQFVVDKTGEFIRREEQLLIVSANLSLTQAWNIVANLGGVFIPAHVNRKAFGLLENLGLVPTDIPLRTLEISRHLPSVEAVQRFPQLKGYKLIKGGDAHRLEELAGFNQFWLIEPTFQEIKKALNEVEGRHILIQD